MAGHAAATVATGGLPPAMPMADEAREFEKILKISDEIFTGTHPRLKVPQQFVRKLPSRPVQNVATIQTKAAKSGPSPPGPEKRSHRLATAESAGATPVAVQEPSSRTPPKPTSEIDPIFLTKSDDLVRAEIQLQRQRVERALREQLDQRRLESRQKTFVQDAKPDFDVSDVLNKALEIVKPVEPSERPMPNGAAAAEAAAAPSESLDENSFYSSRAPDSPQPGSQQKPSPGLERPVPPRVEDGASNAPVDHDSDELQRLEALNHSGSDREMQDVYPVADQPTLSQKQHPSAQQAADVLEEPEYSPPAPDVPPMDHRQQESREYHQGFAGNARRRTYDSDHAYVVRRSVSPSRDVRVIRNHITSPAAPQPSHVSPLAVAKVPSVQHLREARRDYSSDRTHPEYDSGRASPEGPPQSQQQQQQQQQLMPRKRRRVYDDQERTRYRRQGVDSPEPYIKEEPMSPPPVLLTDMAPAVRSRRAQQEQPIYIDIASPRYTPVVDRREPTIREPVYEVDAYGRMVNAEMAGMEAGIPRNLSRASSIRRAAREEQDLRKVASLHQHQHHQHHARQPVQEYPREYMETLGPRVVRAASYAYVDRGAAPDRARYYDEPAAAGYSRRLVVPAEEAPVSPRYRETYYEEEPAGRIMAPPPPQRRIVVDVHGNQYYETVAAPRMQTMVPGVATRLTKGDVYEEHVPMRAASVRAASIIDDAYGGERRYVQEMPPPPPTYRRVPVVDYTRPAGSEQPHHQQAPPPPHHYIDERDTLIRPGSVQVGEYAVRRSYVDEPHDLGRERVVRVSSVRPTHTHAHEESREGVQRIASVRPGGREVSTYVDEDPRRPREYIERAVYLTSARGGREERYLEAGEEGLDESRDVRRIRRY